MHTLVGGHLLLLVHVDLDVEGLHVPVRLTGPQREIVIVALRSPGGISLLVEHVPPHDDGVGQVLVVHERTDPLTERPGELDDVTDGRIDPVSLDVGKECCVKTCVESELFL